MSISAVTVLVGCSQNNGVSALDISNDKIALSEPNNRGCQLLKGQELYTNQYLLSNNGQYKLVLQADGNLVLYIVQTNRAIWATNTSGKPVVKAAMQTDGNFVLYGANNQPFWKTNTNVTDDAYIVLQNDRNLVLYGYVFGKIKQTSNSIIFGYAYFRQWASDTQI